MPPTDLHTALQREREHRITDNPLYLGWTADDLTRDAERHRQRAEAERRREAQRRRPPERWEWRDSEIHDMWADNALGERRRVFGY